MRSRALAAVVLLALVAGCGALFADGGGESTPAETVTPAPVPEVTPTPERWPVAPGLTGSGVADVDVLVAAHLDAVANRSYTWREHRGAAVVFDGTGNTTALDGGAGTDTGLTDGAANARNTSVVLSLSTFARVASPTEYLAWASSHRLSVDGETRPVANYTEYSGGAARYVRYRFSGGPQPNYDQLGVVDAGDSEVIGQAAADAIRRYLPAENATVAETLDDGELAYEVHAYRDDIPGVGSIHDYAARAVVSPDGFVRSLNVSYVAVSAGITRQVHYRFAYTRINETSADEPSWVGERRGT
jgi:hypothetical protein